MVAPLTAALQLGTTLIERFIPDKEKQQEAQLELLTLASKGELATLAASAGIIEAEAKSDSWLAKNWRPIVMLTFCALIVARWLGYSAPNLQPEEYIMLWKIVEFGLGGYVVGRSTEKVASTIATALKDANWKQR